MDRNGKKMNNKVTPSTTGADLDSPAPGGPMMDNLVDTTPNLGDGPSIEDELHNNSNMFRDEAKAEVEGDERRESRTSLIARILERRSQRFACSGL